MTEMMLNLTILPVGPRNAFRAVVGERWRFALQVAASFDPEPAEAERADCARAMLPWLLFHGTDAPLDLWWQTFRANHPATPAARVEAFPARELDFPLHDELDLDVRTVVERQWVDFATKPDPPRTFVVSTTGGPAEVTNENDVNRRFLLPPVLQAFGGATPALASGTLRCTWYFQVTLDQRLVSALVETQDDPLRIAAWPVRFNDSRIPIEFVYDTAGAAFELHDRLVRIGYAANNVVRIRAQTLPFRCTLDTGVNPHVLKTREDALKTYWLPGQDSRLDSMAEVVAVAGEALSARARIGALTAELLVGANVVPNGSSDPHADARLFLDLARRHVPDQAVAPETVQSLIAEAIRLAKQNGVTLPVQLRATLAADAASWWPTVVALVNQHALQERISTQWPPGQAGSLFDSFASLMLPETSEVRPVLPNEGLDVLLGAADARLRHVDASVDDTANDSDHAQIAELGVLVRRARTKTGLSARAWSVATASVAVLDPDHHLDGLDRYWGSVLDTEAGIGDETLRYDRQPVVRGIASAFVNGLASTDITYRGTPLAAATVGSVLHGYEGDERLAPAFAELRPISFQPVGPVRQHARHAERCLVPPLRYGDFYQFAGFVIDRGGGLPDALSRPAHDRGPVFDWDQLEHGPLAAETANCEPIEFLRRVAVGEVNVQPVPDARHPAERPNWPALPADVVLRSREWLSAHVEGGDAVPALLLSDGTRFTRQLPAASFRVSAPVVDEHTLSRWMMPGAVESPDELPAAQAALEALDALLADIHRKRAALTKDMDWQEQQQLLPFDPAVAKIGLRRRMFDANGVATESEDLLDLEATISVFVRHPGNLPAGTHLELPSGSFAVLELLPLVKQDDFARFEALAMRELIEEEPWIGTDGVTYVAFRPTRVLVESATDALPGDRDLYDVLTLTELPNGAIEISMAAKNGGALPGMAFVDRFELARQRWVWRNRPIFDVSATTKWQSELPPLLGDPKQRDLDVSVVTFDALAVLDRGLVDRGRVGGRVPRAADGTPFPAPRLLVDDRDAVSHADYLRFGCTLFSRYRGILAGDAQRVVAMQEHADVRAKALEPKRTWRRIVARFRGDATRIKAPKVLAILPLTNALESAPPPGVSRDATPFLIVLDEVWFREYGPGERLDVEIVLETKEIGEERDDPRPFRVGPLPDHYVASFVANAPFVDRHLYGTSTDPEQDGGTNRHTFPLFGPFGYSLDRSGNEALANATAFVAYPPKDIGPHYAAYVRLRRSLHEIDGTLLAEGPPGGTYALYTQPDTAQLVPATKDALRIAGAKYSGIPLHLEPLARPHDTVVRQYRYLLILGRTVRDLGRGTDLFFPEHAAWLRGSDTSVDWLAPKAPDKGRYTGRVLELLLNGRYAAGTAPIEGTASLRDVLAALFRDLEKPEDALAMIRRMSHPFDVTIE